MTTPKILNGVSCEVRHAAPHTCRTSWVERMRKDENGNWITEIAPRDPTAFHFADKPGEHVTNVSMAVIFGLHHLRGNSSPYFSVTVDGRENGREGFGGCCHDKVLQHFPQLADLVALHLCDMDGAPMYADSNGFYWLAGIVDMGQEYHGGSGQYGKPASECIRIAADHFRITEKEVIALAGRCNKAFKAGGTDAAKAVAKEFTDAQRPRWKAEALAAVKRWELGVYGYMPKTHSETVAMIEGNDNA